MAKERVLTLVKEPLSARTFWGLGAQADGYVYDGRNARYGVGVEDYKTIERRLSRLQLANARMFLDLRWFNPTLRDKTFAASTEDARCCVDQIRRHMNNGTLCNLVLFEPIPGKQTEVLGPVDLYIGLIQYLINVEGLTNIRWITLWNEPDSHFLHDSPLMRRIFGDNAFSARLRWSDYVAANRKAYEMMESNGLSSQVKLLVADCVWGARVRAERMKLAIEAFGDMDVEYSYHNYNPEDQEFYKGNPDFAYDGMAKEAAEFRRLLGPHRPLLLTEFNAAGGGFSASFMGCGPAGSEIHGSIEGAVTVADKVIKTAAEGVDGFTIWLLHDVVIACAEQIGPYRHGLWRYRSEGWLPRPTYHYYSALMDAFRKGCSVYRVKGVGGTVSAVACEYDGSLRVAVLNTGKNRANVRLETGLSGDRIVMRRVDPMRLPAVSDMPSFVEDTIVCDNGYATFTLEPSELVITIASSGTGQQN